MNEQSLNGFCQSCCTSPNPPWQCSYSEFDCGMCESIPIGDHVYALLFGALVVFILILKEILNVQDLQR